MRLQNPTYDIFSGAVGDEFIFMEENAQPHTAVPANDYFEEESIHWIVWPARYLDLSPKKQVWDALERTIAG